MCGIAGIIVLKGFDPHSLITMTNLVSYRGPDASGFVFACVADEKCLLEVHNAETPASDFLPTIGLGHRRLSILDLSDAGAQPMKSADGRLYITYNGEVYNYLEVRHELEKLGHCFHTHTDTEVVLQAYQEWGSECFAHFNGMWSLAIWDRNRHKLVCARDRFGVKPFYYYLSRDHFVFGSEIKQILHTGYVEPEANPAAVLTYLEQGLSDHGADTFFHEIYQLLPAHILTLDLSSTCLQAQFRRYWELSTDPCPEMSDEEARERFRSSFARAVTWRMRSDVPVGSCLSGGLDSSSIVCQSRKVVSDGDFHTFSACFEEPKIDERPYIASIVAATGAEPHLIFPKATDFWEQFERLLWHQNEPFGSTNVYAQWCVMQAARREHIPVLLDGQGGDETLCGYLKFRIFYLEGLLLSSPFRAVSEAIQWLKKGIGARRRWDDVRRYCPGFLSGAGSLTKRVSPGNVWKECASHRVSLGAASSISERQKVDLTCSSLPVLLRLEDRNSMAHSIETRLPFLDYELAQFLVSCPASLKLRNGWSKWILRDALIGQLPEKVRQRRTKLGFDTPISEWLDIGLRNGATEALSQPLRMGRFLLRDRVQQEVNLFLHHSPRCLGPGPLFRVLSLERWAQLFQVN